MKFFLIASIFFAVPFYSLSQQIDAAALARLTPEKRLEVDSILAKKKSHVAGGIIMVGIGTLMGIGSVLVLANELEHDDWTKSDENYAPGIILFSAGVTVGCLSIIPFKKSREENRQARAIVFGKPNAYLSPGIILPRTATINIGLAIPLGK